MVRLCHGEKVTAYSVEAHTEVEAYTELLELVKSLSDLQFISSIHHSSEDEWVYLTVHVSS